MESGNRFSDGAVRTWAESKQGVQAMVVGISCVQLMTPPEKSAAGNLVEIAEDVVKFSSDESKPVDPSINVNVSKSNRQWTENLLIRNIDAIGWNWVESVDYGMGTVHLRVNELCPFEKFLRVTFDARHPEQLLVATETCNVGKFDWLSAYKFAALLNIKDEYMRCYEKHADFFKQLYELKHTAVVLEEYQEPALTSQHALGKEGTLFVPKAVVWKVLLLRQSVTVVAARLILSYQTDHSSLECSCDCIEATQECDKKSFTALWEQKRNDWSRSSSLKQNIELIFSVNLTAARTEWNRYREDTLNTTITPECSICYSMLQATVVQNGVVAQKRRRADKYQNEESQGVPMPPENEICCQNAKCNKLFHAECAKHWLLSLPDVKKSFGTIFGQCPYCGDILEVKE